jgi:signal transduction histidine kinase
MSAGGAQREGGSLADTEERFRLLVDGVRDHAIYMLEPDGTDALKYGAGKPIEVRVRGEPGKATVAVRDHGIGIPPEHQVRIFEHPRGGATFTVVLPC